MYAHPKAPCPQGRPATKSCLPVRKRAKMQQPHASKMLTLERTHIATKFNTGVGADFPLLRGAGFGAKNRDTGANFEKKRGAFQSLLPAETKLSGSHRS